MNRRATARHCAQACALALAVAAGASAPTLARAHGDAARGASAWSESSSSASHSDLDYRTSPWAAPTAQNAGGAGAIALGPGDSLSLSPFWEWRTLVSDHFRMTFPKELEATARKAVDYLEEAHRLLAPALQWEPRFRVQVLLVDNTDSANGMAMAVQRFGMVLYATPPESYFSTSYADDWLKLLCFHEYTHILNLDPTRGPIYQAWRLLNGDTFLPNSLWAPWMLEGLATFSETRLTSAGRGRSPLWRAQIRAAAVENKLGQDDYISLGRLTGNVPFFPGGEIPYLYGYEMMNELSLSARSEETGISALGRMSIQSAERVPYFINGNAENTLGRSWETAWTNWLERTKSRTQSELSLLQTAPVTRPRALTQQGYNVSGIAVSPDGKSLLVGRSSLHERNALWLIDLASGRERRLAEKIGGASVAFADQGRLALHSSLRRRGSKDLFNEYSDLQAVDLVTGKATWLTHGLRAKDPSVSPDGNFVVFTQAGDERVSLVVAELSREQDGTPKIGQLRRLWAPERWGRASQPVFDTSAKRIVFSVQTAGLLQEDLMELDWHPALAQSEESDLPARTLLSDGFFHRYPTFGKDGALYFISDRTGVLNLWRLAAGDPKPTLQTNVLTALQFPAFSPDGRLFASHLGAEGWNLAEVPLSRMRLDSERLTLPKLEVPREGSSQDSVRTTAAAAISNSLTVQDYSAWPSLLPRQWGPYLTLAGTGLQSVGAFVYGYDAVDRHRYFVLGDWNRETSTAEGLAIYQNRSFATTLGVQAQRSSSLVLDSSGTWAERTDELDVSASLPIQWTFSTLTPSLEWNREQNSWTLLEGVDPIGFFSNLPDDSFTARVRFADGRSSRLAVTTEEGFSSSLGVRAYATRGGWKAHAGHRHRFHLGGHTVLIPSVQGVVTDGGRTALSSARARIRGRNGTLTDSLSGDALDTLIVRGYSGQSFWADSLGLAALDLTFPLAYVFRGWSTNPVFFDQWVGGFFVEAAQAKQVATLSETYSSATLPSLGASIETRTTWGHHIPVLTSLNWNWGTNAARGGQQEVFLLLRLGAI